MMIHSSMQEKTRFNEDSSAWQVSLSLEYSRLIDAM